MARLITIVIFLLVASLPLKMQAQSEATERNQKTHPHNEQSVPSGFVDSVTSDNTPHDHEEHPCYEPVGIVNRLACSDLYQQWRMAVGTEAMSTASWWQVGISIIGICLIGATLYYTREAAKAAKNALEVTRDTLNEAQSTTVAAQESVNVTRQIGESELRAYLQLTEFKWAIRPGQEAVTIFAKVSNVGATPAFNPKLAIKVNLSPSDSSNLEAIEEIVSMQLPDIRAGVTIDRVVTFANVVVPRRIYGENYEQLLTGSAAVVCFANDAFGREIYTASRYSCAYGVCGLPSILDATRPNQTFRADSMSPQGFWELWDSLDFWRHFDPFTYLPVAGLVEDVKRPDKTGE